MPNFTNSAITPIPQQTTVPSITVSATTLYAAYEANTVSADNLYKNKVIAIEGKVLNVGTDILGDAYVILAGDKYDVWGIQCYFKNPQALANLTPGMNVRITGEVDSYLINVIVKDCH
jgi:hypothetical protein